MQIVTWLIWELLSYDVRAWLAFVAIAICATLGSWQGAVGGHMVVAAMVLGLDLYWIRAEMSSQDGILQRVRTTTLFS